MSSYSGIRQNYWGYVESLLTQARSLTRSSTGFGGSWGVEGKHFNEKMELLTKEGVKFDSKGRVKGPVFENYTPV